MSTNNDTPIVIDLGTNMTKAGFAGEPAPQTVFPSCAQVVNKPAGLAGLMGTPVHKYGTPKGYYRIVHALKGCNIDDMDTVEKVLHAAIYDELQVAPEEHPIVVLHASQWDKQQRERLLQMLMETFNAPNAFLANVSEVTLLASGSLTGTVVECGHGASYAVPIYEGATLTDAVQRLPFAGDELTKLVQAKMAEKGVSLTTSADLEVVCDIKEKLCYVPQDMDAEQDNVDSFERVNYELPDGQMITVGAERFEVGEALFTPSIMGKDDPGIHTMTYNAIMAADADVRAELFANVVLTGGTAHFAGFEQRMQTELEALVAQSGDEYKVNVSTVSDPKYAAWIGASSMANSPSFLERSISKAEYDDAGPGIVWDKCDRGMWKDE